MENGIKHFYQIKDMELISGIKAHTIRIWEQRFNIFNPERTSTNIRYYSDEDLRKLLGIVILLKKGHKISKLKDFDHVEIHRLVSELELYESYEESLVIAMLNFDGVYFNSMIQKSIAESGFENTFVNLIYPLLIKVGTLWLTGAITPTHEHFFSNVIRQKLFSEIDKLPEPTAPTKSVLLFLPGTELHETGLLFSYYLAKLNNCKTLYLGQAVPVEDVVNAAAVFNPDVIICFFVAQTDFEYINASVARIENSYPNSTLLISGNQVNSLPLNSFKQAKIIMSSQELINYLK